MTMLNVFTDLHFGERNGDLSYAEWGTKAVREALAQSTAVYSCTTVGSEEPEADGSHPHYRRAKFRVKSFTSSHRASLNLISPYRVFGGDQITGENTFYENSTAYLDQILHPTVERQLPFATIYGNNDNSYNVTHKSLYDYEKQHYASLSKTQAPQDSADDPMGVFQSVIPIFAQKGGPPVLILWLFDSRSSCYSLPNADVGDTPWQTRAWVDPKVANWIESEATAIKQKYDFLPPALAFVHLPPSPVKALQESTAHFNAINDDAVDVQGKNSFYNVNEADLPFWNAVTQILGGPDGSNLLALTMG